MFKKPSFFALCLICIVISACISQKEFAQLKAEQEVLRTRILSEQEIRHSQLRTEQEQIRRELAAVKKGSLSAGKKNEILDTMNALANEMEELQRIVQEQEGYISKLVHEKKLDEYQKDVEIELQDEINRGHVEIKKSEDELKITLPGRMLFAGPDLSIKSEGKDVLLTLARLLRDHEELNVEVQGHTDSEKPGERTNFVYNWWLSWLRAMRVVTMLQDRGIDPARLRPIGFGPSRPVDYVRYWEKTERPKSQNRRIEIILCPAIK